MPGLMNPTIYSKRITPGFTGNSKPNKGYVYYTPTKMNI